MHRSRTSRSDCSTDSGGRAVSRSLFLVSRLASPPSRLHPEQWTEEARPVKSSGGVVEGTGVEPEADTDANGDEEFAGASRDGEGASNG